MSDPTPEERRKLCQEWAYFRPAGPEPDDTKANIERMHPDDVKRLLEIGDEMAEALSSR